MARKKRIWYPGAIYHVMSRGNRREEIFKDHLDYLDFLEYAGIIKDKYHFHIHALCLMTNHFHMAIETQDTEIWKIMQKILSVYAESYNHRYNYSGHLFQGRYTACLIEDERYLLEVSRYIHLNPVKAAMVRNPLKYEYSSYNLFVSDDRQPKRRIDKAISNLIDTSRVLSYFCNDQNNPRKEYKEFVEGETSHTEQEMLIKKDMREDETWSPIYT